MTGVEPGAGAAAGICRACKTRDCCRSEVGLSGADVVRIARALQVNPDHFAVLIAARGGEGRADELVRLGRRHEPHRLVLRRRETEPGRGDEACTFLLELRSGRRLCGLAELAPAACRLFPRDPDGGLHAGPGCWRAWTEEEAPRDEAATTAAVAERTRWHAVVAAWNARVAKLEGVDPATFLAHLFTAYA
jgi:hypothetical protein